MTGRKEFYLLALQTFRRTILSYRYIPIIILIIKTEFIFVEYKIIANLCTEIRNNFTSTQC